MSEEILVTLEQIIEGGWKNPYQRIQVIAGRIRIDKNRIPGMDSVVCASHRQPLRFDIRSLGSGVGIYDCPSVNCPTAVKLPVGQ